jgi:hypothetical protein
MQLWPLTNNLTRRCITQENQQFERSAYLREARTLYRSCTEWRHISVARTVGSRHRAGKWPVPGLFYSPRRCSCVVLWGSYCSRFYACLISRAKLESRTTVTSHILQKDGVFSVWEMNNLFFFVTFVFVPVLGFGYCTSFISKEN